MESPEERARRRAAEWTGEVVTLGTPKRGLYADLTPAQRLEALARLNERAWRASGRESLRRTPRHEWPVEIFECGARE